MKYQRVEWVEVSGTKFGGLLVWDIIEEDCSALIVTEDGDIVIKNFMDFKLVRGLFEV